MTNCNNCNHELTGKYCSGCGQPVQLKRIDSHYIMHEIEHVLHIEKGILFTIKELLIRPGQNIREFIKDNRMLTFSFSAVLSGLLIDLFL